MQQERELAPLKGVAATGFVHALLDAVVLRICARLLDGRAKGQIKLTLPSGRSRAIGSGEGANAALALSTYGVFFKSLRRGSIGFAESYIEGETHTRDLAELFRFFLDNKPGLQVAGGGWFKVRSRDRRWHLSRANTREGSQRNIADHYDLGNDFYAAWLDPGMTYSSARFADGIDDLQAAQDEKNRRLLDALEVSTGQQLLEIGSGWGGFAEAAARRGIDVTGLTVSQAQLQYAEERLRAARLADRARVRFQDYRDVEGSFDRIASVEMIEAVGEEHWPAYFGTIADRLRPGGVAVLQAITIDPVLFEGYRRKADFIQRFIFPGGMLPTTGHMERRAAAAGLSFEVLETFGQDYARTLQEWRHRFDAAWPAISALGFDEHFRRMWDYYLVYCQVGFEKGVIDVGHYRLRKPVATHQ